MTGIFSISGSTCKTGYHLSRLLAILFVGLAGIPYLFGQQKSQAEDLLSVRGEVIVTFMKPAGLSMEWLSTVMSIDRIDHDTITAYLNREQFDAFRDYAIPYVLRTPPSLKKFRELKKREIADWRIQYPSYADYKALMQDFATSYPSLATLVDIGTTPGNHQLMAMRISGTQHGRKKPVVFLSSSIHGDEPLGCVMMMRLIETLLTLYSEDPEIRHLVDSVEIYINPLANPDGTYFQSDSSIAGATRFNSNHVDLNRNFPDPERGDHPDGMDWQPETVLMMHFMNLIRPQLSANFHGGAELVNYPWDSFQRHHADDEWFRYISRGFADTAHARSNEGYMDEQENGITNGYAWYQVFGGRQDYVTYFIRGREVTIELSDDKIPNENRLADYWNYINRSLLQYISRVFTGIFGTVTDLATSLPVAAVISIRNHDMDQSEVIADSSDGHFYRFTLPGTFTLDFQAPGYQPETITLNVTPDDLAYASVKLSKGQQLSIFPNPFSELLRIYVPVSNIFLALDFTDMSGRNIKRIVQSVVTSGWQEVEVTGLAPGVYIVHATAGQMHLQETLLKIR